MSANSIELLKTARSTLSLTQKELAIITGFTAQNIADYETARARVPGDLVLSVQALLRAHEKQQRKEDRS